MTSDPFVQRVETLFLAVQDMDASAVELFLAAAAARDPEAAAEVKAMLALNDDELDDAVPRIYLDDTAIEVEAPGQHIDRYVLKELLGEGGFGTVWRAEQQEPVRRDVALKIIKRGMDTRQVVARFQAERQTLARMDHPGIARVFDGGATATGRPYFVMELVRGDPLLAACDRLQLELRARLQLFHRDLKPSNVLVETHREQPSPKVIDFGIAKVLDDSVAGATALTQLQQLVGTPAYMAPEQASPDGPDVDTRTDVYALGVVLYELLAGANPFAGIEREGILGMLRLIQEHEPPKPSTHKSQLHGELDWIVMKAIEKDRARRYGSVREFAADLVCYLRCEPVLAGPPSATYRARKFVRRHRLQMSAAAAVLISLVAGLVASIWFALDAREQSLEAGRQERAAIESAERARLAEGAARDLARRESGLRAAAERAGQRAQATTTFLLDTIGLADPDVTQLPDTTMRGALHVAADAVGEAFRSYPDSEAALRIVIGRAYLALGVPAAALSQLERAHALHANVLPRDPRPLFRITRMLGRTKYLLGDIAWVDLGRETMRLGIEAVTALQPEVGAALSAYSTEVRRPLFSIDTVHASFDRVIEVAREVMAPEDELWFEVSWLLWCHAYELGWSSSDLVLADFMERALALHRQITHGRTTLVVRQMSRTALQHRLRSGDYAGAERSARTTLERLTPQIGADHAHLVLFRSILGHCLALRGEFTQAEPMLREALAAMTVDPDSNRFEVVDARERLAHLLDATGRNSDAQAERDRIVELLIPLAMPSNWHGVSPAFPPGEGSVRELGDEVEQALREAARGQFDRLRRALPRLIARGREELPADSALRTLHACHLVAIGSRLTFGQAWGPARDVLAEAYRIVRNDHYDHPDLEFTAACQLGSVLGVMGQFADAEEPLREALRLAPRVTTPDARLRTMLARLQLGRDLRSSGRLEEAEPLLQAAYFDQFALDASSAVPAAALREEWCALLGSIGQPDRARRLLGERLAAARATSAGESPESLRLLCELAALLGSDRMSEVADLVVPVLPDALQTPGLFPGVGHDLAWFVVRAPGRSPTDYGTALDLIDRALRRDPLNRAFVNTRGVALYRVGRDAEAVEALLESDCLNPTTADPEPANLAFLALAQLRLGRIEAAASAYELLDGLMRREANANNPECRALHAEVMARWQR